MAVENEAVTVGTSAVALNPAQNEISVAIYVAAGTVFTGGPDVTAATGFPVTDRMAWDLGRGDILYAIAESDVDVVVQRIRA